MSNQTKAEKIELVQSEIKQAETMVKYSRAQLERWINLLDLHRETLGRLKGLDAKA